MKKTVLVLVFGLALSPSIAFAAWWSPTSWKIFQKAAKPQEAAIVATTTAPDRSLEPTIDDLKKRIAELEDKLERALSQKDIAVMKAQAEMAAKITQKSAASAAPRSSGLTEKEITAKVRPAIVLVETPVGSASGSIIDARGYVLTNARIVLARDSNGAVAGPSEDISVNIYGGAKKKATLVGVDEEANVAVLQISDKGSYNFIKPNHDAGIAEGDTAYVLSLPLSGSSSGYGTIDATIMKKGSASIEINSTRKPFDSGGAVVNDQGGLIGIPGASSCKVLEEGKTCLKYAVTANIIRSKLPKLMSGMRLYATKQSTREERLVRGALEGMYNNVKGSQAVEFGVSVATGKNSFDSLNVKLGKDEDGKITRLYLAKLVSAAEAIHKAVDTFKDQSYNLRTFLINESITVEALGEYQRSIIAGIQAENEKKLAEYKEKVNFWSAKKNEYDSYLTKWSEVSHNYLLEEGAFVEDSTKYIVSEKERIMKAFSGENVEIF
ncbi:MAG: serine protease [Candidatus Paceibacterota bacterium]|jgi:S1-C subfamily serine protease